MSDKEQTSTADVATKAEQQPKVEEEQNVESTKASDATPPAVNTRASELAEAAAKPLPSTPKKGADEKKNVTLVETPLKASETVHEEPSAVVEQADEKKTTDMGKSKASRALGIAGEYIREAFKTPYPALRVRTPKKNGAGHEVASPTSEEPDKADESNETEPKKQQANAQEQSPPTSPPLASPQRLLSKIRAKTADFKQNLSSNGKKDEETPAKKEDKVETTDVSAVSESQPIKDETTVAAETSDAEQVATKAEAKTSNRKSFVRTLLDGALSSPSSEKAEGVRDPKQAGSTCVPEATVTKETEETKETKEEDKPSAPSLWIRRLSLRIKSPSSSTAKDTKKDEKVTTHDTKKDEEEMKKDEDETNKANVTVTPDASSPPPEKTDVEGDATK